MSQKGFKLRRKSYKNSWEKTKLALNPRQHLSSIKIKNGNFMTEIDASHGILDKHIVFFETNAL